ncbi:MAG: protein-disulfide reductase DsbD N-terminal domain-containing protein [Myxococcota bacterium]|nr:protein-disulfide reductase DsbD N-terminal domain-containing protein [Myxococcota bacterium]
MRMPFCPALRSLLAATLCGSLLGTPALGAGTEGGKLTGAALAPASKPYTITVARISAQRGQPATAKVVIRPAKGWHLNKDFPTRLTLRLPAGVSANKTELNKSDAVLDDNEGRFEVVLTSKEAGQKKVPGDLRFAVCTESSCDPQRSEVTIEMDVR